MRRPIEFIFSPRDVRPAVSDILTVILWCIIDHRCGVTMLFALRRFSAETPSSFASPRLTSLRNTRKIETWWRFTRTKTDRLLREFNRLMTACRRWHLVIGGCALLLRVPLLLFLSLYHSCRFPTRDRMLVIAHCFRVCSRTVWKRNRNPLMSYCCFKATVKCVEWELSDDIT